MPKIKYQDFAFTDDRLRIIKMADQIGSQYAAQGFDEVTVRQIYYRFIAKDLFPESWIDEEYNRKKGLDPRTKNTDKNYDRLQSAINDGRLAGLIDWDHIADVTRNVKSNPHWQSPANIISDCASQYREDLWSSQPIYCEVWIEKDALQGVIKGTCVDLDVPYFSCRGYTSSSALWTAAQRLIRKCTEPWDRKKPARDAVIIHCGDHDPSGIDMTRDISEKLDLFVGDDSGFQVRVERAGLNMDQIRELRPPPNPAKLTDARAKGYIERFGNDSWELDALEPAQLNALIRSKIQALIDYEFYVKAINAQEKGKKQLTKLSARWESVAKTLEKKR